MLMVRIKLTAKTDLSFPKLLLSNIFYILPNYELKMTGITTGRFPVAWKRNFVTLRVMLSLT